jgi:hypothetical protein
MTPITPAALTMRTRNSPGTAGKPAAAQRRKRGVLNAIGYAVELGVLAANRVDRIQRKSPGAAETVDRRVVVSPAQATALLAGVRAQGSRGEPPAKPSATAAAQDAATPRPRRPAAENCQCHTRH